VFRRFHDHAPLDFVVPRRGCAAPEAVDFGAEEHGEDDVTLQEWQQQMEGMAHCDDIKTYHKERAELMGVGEANGWLQRKPDGYFWFSRIYTLKRQILSGQTVHSLLTGKPLLCMTDVERRICQGSEELTEAIRLIALNNHRLAANSLKLVLNNAVYQLLFEHRADLDNEMQEVEPQKLEKAS